MIKALYTGATKEEAQTRAQENLDIVNVNLHKFNPSIFWDNVQYLTAEPIIDNLTYYYSFAKPFPNIEEGYEADLEAEYDQAWFLPEEPEEF